MKVSKQDFSTQWKGIAIFLLLIFIKNFFVYWVSMHQLRKDISELTRKTLWTKNLIKESWLGLSFVISF